MAWARLKNIRTISTLQIYSGQKPGVPAYCLDGTDGTKKVRYTLRHNRRFFQANGSTDLPRDVLKVHDQVILEKQCEDPFDEPRADRMLTELRADEFVVLGATTEGAVRATVLGLLARNKYVTLLVDALGSVDKSAAEVALRQMEAKGAHIKHVTDLLGRTHVAHLHACGCDRCMGMYQKDLIEATGT